MLCAHEKGFNCAFADDCEVNHPENCSIVVRRVVDCETAAEAKIGLKQTACAEAQRAVEKVLALFLAQGSKKGMLRIEARWDAQ